jgi:transcriptional regulator with XRE-family HTH domain
MLPNKSATEFPDALKTARESKHLNFTQLAELCDINPAMPSRYENRKHGNFGPPSDKTWNKLNQVLFGDTSLTSVEKRLLEEASIEELIQTLKNRGATSVTVTL